MGVVHLDFGLLVTLFVLFLWGLAISFSLQPDSAPLGFHLWGVLIYTPLPLPWIVVGVGAIRNHKWSCLGGLLLLLPTSFLTLLVGWWSFLMDRSMGRDSPFGLLLGVLGTVIGVIYVAITLRCAWTPAERR